MFIIYLNKKMIQARRICFSIGKVSNTRLLCKRKNHSWVQIKRSRATDTSGRVYNKICKYNLVQSELPKTKSLSYLGSVDHVETLRKPCFLSRGISIAVVEELGYEGRKNDLLGIMSLNKFQAYWDNLSKTRFDDTYRISAHQYLIRYEDGKFVWEKYLGHLTLHPIMKSRILANQYLFDRKDGQFVYENFLGHSKMQTHKTQNEIYNLSVKLTTLENEKIKIQSQLNALLRAESVTK